MKMLVIYTNPNIIIKNTGARTRLIKLFKLFSSRFDMKFFGPRITGGFPKNVEVFNFEQWSICGKNLAIFTDFNLSYFSNLKKLIKKSDVDLIFIALPYGVILCSYICRHIPLIYDAENVIKGTPSRLLSDELENKFPKIFHYLPISKMIGSIIMKYLSLLEGMACNRANHIVAISELDKLRLIKLHNVSRDKITVIPHYISSNELKDISYINNEKKSCDVTTVVFHGSCIDHPANYEAFKLVINYIAPEIEKYNANIQFLIAGTNVPIFERRNVKSLGFVKDVNNFLQRADIAIIPFLSGSGVKIKIFDYIVAGLPIITTKNGIEGIDVENGKHIIIVETVDHEFINAILLLANDNEKKKLLQENITELVRTMYSAEVAQAKMEQMLEQVKSLK